MRLFSGSQLAASVDAACPAAQAWTVDVRLYSSPLPRQQRLRLPRRQPGTRGSSRGFGSGRERLPSPARCPLRSADASREPLPSGGDRKPRRSAVVRNMGRTPCSLLGRPRARLVGTRALETAWRVVPARSPSPDLSAIYDPPSSLRGLAQGRAAWVPLRWSNWCPPGTSETSTGPPPDALVLVLPHRRGNLPWGAKTQSERQKSFICRG
jgi:hypothetical protein